MSDLQRLERKVDRLTILVECVLRGESLHEVAGYTYGRTSQDAAFILLYPAANHLKHKICRVYEEDFGKLPAFINTAVPETTQDGNPTRDQAKRQRIYQHTAIFTITTIEGKDTQMGPEVRFSRVIDAHAPAGPSQQQPTGQNPEPRPSTPPPPATPEPDTAVNQEIQETAVSSNGNGSRPDTAEHWCQEAKTATEALMFDTAVSRLENWFQDANSAASFRETLFGDWQPNLVTSYLESLLRYAEVRKILNGRHPTKAAHDKAKIEALNTFNRLVPAADSQNKKG